MDISNNTSRALPFSQQWHNNIDQLWQRGNFSYFIANDGIKIHYAAFNLDRSKPSIVLSPGRGEGYLKYKELACDLINQGYQLFIIDHRGQGLSDRLLNNPYKGYVNQFDQYADDLYQFINKIVMPCCQHSKPFLLAHSMGGAIAIRLLQKYPNAVTASVLCSPMIAINTGLIPSFIAKSLVFAMQAVNRICSTKPWYFFGQQDYKPFLFANNKLSHCQQRHQIFSQLYRQFPQLQLGGVTVHWLIQALQCEKDIFQQLEKITSPVYVIQAGEDQIVSNQAQTDFCAQLHNINPAISPQSQPKTIANAKHELFFERDVYRRPALESVFNWFSQYS